MKWFEGSVKDAVTVAKEKNCFFIVYVEGYGRPSETMASAINSEEISQVLESDSCVSLKIKTDSEEYYQFVEVYKHVPTPSLFFIGENGVPIAVVHNTSDEDEQSIFQQIVKAIFEHISCNNCCLSEINDSEKSVKINDISSNSSTFGSETMPIKNSNNDMSEGITLSESVQLLKQDYESKGSENERVSISISSQDVSNSKIESEEKEMDSKETKIEKKMPLKIQQNKIDEEKRILQGMKLEKVEYEQNRQRILNEIAQDREERLVRQQEINILRHSVSGEKQSSSRPSTSVGENQTCIQFRKPDGTTHTAIFHKTSVIDDVRRYVTYNVPLKFRKFDLAIAFPRHVFTAEENNRSLEELNLTTNNVLLILPTAQNFNSVNSSIHTIFRRVSHVCWYIVYPIFSLTTFLQNTIFRIFPLRQTNNLNETQVIFQAEPSLIPLPSQSQETSFQNNDVKNRNIPPNEDNKSKTTINPVNINDAVDNRDLKSSDVVRSN